MDSDSYNDRKGSDETAEHEEAPKFGSYAGRTSDKINTGERVRYLRQQIPLLGDECNELQLQITSKEQERNGIEEHGRGWPLLAVVLMGIVTIGLEYFPATQFTQIFDASDTQRFVFTAIFTIVPAILALALGELLRRCRVPSRQRIMDTLLLAAAAALTVTFLAVGFWLRLAYTSASATVAIGLTPWMEALALTSIATIGVALTVISAYYREGIKMYQVSRDLARLRGELAELENHLRIDLRDLERAEAAYRGEPVPLRTKWSIRKPTPVGGMAPASTVSENRTAASTNGVQTERMETVKHDSHGSAGEGGNGAASGDGAPVVIPSTGEPKS